MRALVVVVVCACGATPPTPDHSRPISVRLAKADEFPHVPSGENVSAILEHMNCEVHGIAAPWLYDSVVAFARANLFDQWAHRSLRDAPSRMVDATKPSLMPKRSGVTVMILVDPRGELGQLDVSESEIVDGRPTWGASKVYCLHVLDGVTTTIVLEPWFSVIS